MAVQDVNAVSKDMGTNDHLDQVESQKDGFIEETARVVDHPAERALCFKFDIRILPVLAIMCKSSLLVLPFKSKRVQSLHEEEHPV